jgi:hypothetical protein
MILKGLTMKNGFLKNIITPMHFCNDGININYLKSVFIFIRKLNYTFHRLSQI